MKAFFLLSCLLPFMASGAVQLASTTTPQQDSNPTTTGPPTTTRDPSTTTTTAGPPTTMQGPSTTMTTAGPPTTTWDPSTTTTTTTAGPPTTMQGPSTTMTTAGPPTTTWDPSTTTTTTTAGPPTTTQGPGTTTTTTTAGPPTTMQGPSTTMTTAGPPTTTWDPSTTTTMTTAGPPTTTQGPGTTTAGPPTTTWDPSTTTAGAPTTPGMDLTTQPIQTTSQTLTPTSVSPETCTEKMCHGSSECIFLNNTTFCLCPEGYYYKDPQCKQGRTFPGLITMSRDISDLGNKHSPNYEHLHLEIKDLFGSIFANDTTYGQTVILNLQTFSTTRSEMRTVGQVKVAIVNIFDKSSKIKLDEVNKAIQNRVKTDDNISYHEENPCDFNGCNKTSKDCSNSFECDCLKGLTRPFPLSSCSACSSDCNEKNNKQCIRKSNSMFPECQCLPGYISEEETCRECAFGYSGVGCKDNSVLIFTVVCATGGAILLGTIIGLIVLARSNMRKKSTEEDSLISSEFNNMKLETTGFSNPASSTGSLFPKVTAPQFPRAQSNPYEEPYLRRSMPVRDY